MPDRATARARAAAPLLALITEQSLDADYQVVAERGASQASPRRRRTVIAAVVAMAGVLCTIAFVQTSRSASLERSDKDDLISRVTAAKASLTEQDKKLVALQNQVASSTSALGGLNEQVRALLAELTSLGTTVGSAPLTGPGIEVTVTDGPTQDGEVQDSDLRALINALWLSGARGISVNGQRLSNQNALRNSGTVIRVNGVSLSSPYAVVAVGSTVGNWSATASGGVFRTHADNFGFSYAEAYPGSVTVPAGPSGMLTLTYVKATGKEER